jgi:hypothetical protein
MWQLEVTPAVFAGLGLAVAAVLLLVGARRRKPGLLIALDPDVLSYYFELERVLFEAERFNTFRRLVRETEAELVIQNCVPAPAGAG